MYIFTLRITDIEIKNVRNDRNWGKTFLEKSLLIITTNKKLIQ